MILIKITDNCWLKSKIRAIFKDFSQLYVLEFTEKGPCWKSWKSHWISSSPKGGLPDLWLTYLPGGTCASPSFGVCQQKCTDIKPGPGYYCVCRTGYKISPKNSHYCDDVNECAVFGTCGQKCENFKGSFKCSCYDGYQLSYTRGNTTCKIKGEIWPIITGTTQYFKKIKRKKRLKKN